MSRISIIDYIFRDVIPYQIIRFHLPVNTLKIKILARASLICNQQLNSILTLKFQTNRILEKYDLFSGILTVYYYYPWECYLRLLGRRWSFSCRQAFSTHKVLDGLYPCFEDSTTKFYRQKSTDMYMKPSRAELKHPAKPLNVLVLFSISCLATICI